MSPAQVGRARNAEVVGRLRARANPAEVAQILQPEALHQRRGKHRHGARQVEDGLARTEDRVHRPRGWQHVAGKMLRALGHNEFLEHRGGFRPGCHPLGVEHGGGQEENQQGVDRADGHGKTRMSSRSLQNVHS